MKDSISVCRFFRRQQRLNEALLAADSLMRKPDLWDGAVSGSRKAEGKKGSIRGLDEQTSKKRSRSRLFRTLNTSSLPTLHTPHIIQSRLRASSTESEAVLKMDGGS
jgi:hypothetical protein